jgi:hypothetical protein
VRVRIWLCLSQILTKCRRVLFSGRGVRPSPSEQVRSRTPDDQSLQSLSMHPHGIRSGSNLLRRESPDPGEGRTRCRAEEQPSPEQPSVQYRLDPQGTRTISPRPTQSLYAAASCGGTAPVPSSPTYGPHLQHFKDDVPRENHAVGN